MKKTPGSSAQRQVPQNIVQNCVFQGVKWDGLALDVLRNVTQAIVNITELFKGQQVNIEAMIKVSPDKEMTANQ